MESTRSIGHVGYQGYLSFGGLFRLLIVSCSPGSWNSSRWVGMETCFDTTGCFQVWVHSLDGPREHCCEWVQATCFSREILNNPRSMDNPFRWLCFWLGASNNDCRLRSSRSTKGALWQLLDDSAAFMSIILPLCLDRYSYSRETLRGCCISPRYPCRLLASPTWC